MTNIKDVLLSALFAYDDARPRSRQKAVGVSSLGDCRAKVWHQANGTEPTNKETLRLPALMGTAIHSVIEQAMKDADALIEYRVEHEDLPPATIDYFKNGEIVDWKTSTVAGLTQWPSRRQIWQVQVYGYLLERDGHEVHTVTLVGIPRDGDERNIKVHSEPYDPAVAVQALLWLDDVLEMQEPTPERDSQYCARYCKFYGACSGIVGKPSEPITDLEVSAAAQKYVQIQKDMKALETEKEGLRSVLEGWQGETFDGVTVSWSEVAGRSSIDEDAVKAALGFVPKKQGAPSMRLVVK